jgi:transposase
MESYSKELRRDILRASEAGENTKSVAMRFGVSESWVRRVKQDFREKGIVAPATTHVRIPKMASPSRRDPAFASRAA